MKPAACPKGGVVFSLGLAILSALGFLSGRSAATADDWNQFLGARREGAYVGKALATEWPREGPKRLWQVSVGAGFSGPVTSGGRVVLVHRIGDVERIECFSLTNGASLWRADQATHYQDDFGFDDGPRATPAIAEGGVFTLGADGLARCVELSGGAARWSVPMSTLLHASKGFFGFACSPLIFRDLAIYAVGGTDGACVVGVDLHSGKLIWKALRDDAGYASPVLAGTAKEPWVAVFARSGLALINPVKGEVLDSFRWRAAGNASVNAATPLVSGNEIFISASYETGGALLRFSGGKLGKVWSADGVLSNHYATSVAHEGFLYGFDGRQEQGPALTCVEWATGKVRWRKDGLGAGTVTRTGNEIIVLTEKGEVIAIEASPAGYKQRRRAQILGSGVRAHPAMAEGMLLARGKDKFSCFDLAPLP